MATVWFELTVEVPAACSEAVANFLIETGAPGLQLDERGNSVRLLAHYSEAPSLEPLRRFCADLGASVSDDGIGVREIREEDWAHNWKLHFPPQAVGERLYVCPPWEAVAPPGRVAVVIEPGMAFGTGHHATTCGCLTMLDWATINRRIRRALDVGTGSGILAVALAKLGVPDVWAVDVDAQALAIAAVNAARNDVATAIHFVSHIDLVGRSFELIAANLFANLLQEFAHRLTLLLAPGGLLICSGLLKQDEQEVCKTYEALGFEVGRRHEESDWITLAFSQPPQL